MKKIVFVILAVLFLFACSNKKEEILQLQKKGKDAIPEIAKYLKDPDIEIRKTAVFTLKNICDPSANTYIEEYVNSAKKPMERQWGTEAIAYISTQTKKNKPKPQVVILPINESDPLEVQVNNFVHNFIVEGNPYNKGEELYLEVKGSKVINFTDMTDFYHDTQRNKDWKTFYNYVRRTVLGFPTGDMAGAIFKRFPQIKSFQENAYYGIGKKEIKNGKTFYPKRKVIGKAVITRAKFNKIDPNTKEYLDKLSVTQQYFKDFEAEVKKYLTGIWYDKTIARKANNQKAVGTELE